MLFHSSHRDSERRPAGHVENEPLLESPGEVIELLSRAAEIAAQAGLPIEAFTATAWQAFMNASPGLAEQLAEMQFDAALEELRKSGRLAKA
jgi:hypothetical protein